MLSDNTLRQLKSPRTTDANPRGGAQTTIGARAAYNSEPPALPDCLYFPNSQANEKTNSHKTYSCLHPTPILPSSCLNPVFVLPLSCLAKPRKTAEKPRTLELKKSSFVQNKHMCGNVPFKMPRAKPCTKSNSQAGEV
jgi:hypothetical protein